MLITLFFLLVQIEIRRKVVASLLATMDSRVQPRTNGTESQAINTSTNEQHANHDHKRCDEQPTTTPQQHPNQIARSHRHPHVCSTLSWSQVFLPVHRGTSQIQTTDRMWLVRVVQLNFKLTRIKWSRFYIVNLHAIKSRLFVYFVIVIYLLVRVKVHKSTHG